MHDAPTLFVAFYTPGAPELIVLAVLGLLLFGRRLPEVGRSLGRSSVEFKRGIKGIEDEIDSESSKSRSSGSAGGGNESVGGTPETGGKLLGQTPMPGVQTDSRTVSQQDPVESQPAEHKPAGG